MFGILGLSIGKSKTGLKFSVVTKNQQNASHWKINNILKSESRVAK